MARTNTNTGGGGGGAVDSVNGQTGVVVLDTDDIAEGSINKYFNGVTVDGVTVIGNGDDVPLSAVFDQMGKYMISGGAVWSGTGFVYNVSRLSYFFDGIKTANATQVTLAASDPDFDRIDAIVVDEAGTVSVITGTPALNPVEPSIPDTQLQVQFIIVSAGTTQPTVVEDAIHLDQPTTNWTSSNYTTSGTPVGSTNFSATTSPLPKQGANYIKNIRDARTGIRFVRASNINLTDYTNLSFWVYLPVALATNKNLNVRWENSSGTLIGNTVNAFNYAASRTLTGVWQLVYMPIAAFGNINTVKGLKMIMAGGTNGVTVEWDIDYVILTNGATPGANVPTVTVQQDGVVKGAQSTLNFLGKEVTNDLTNNRINISDKITEGAPAQADRASTTLTVNDVDYTKIHGLQLKFGSVPNQKILEYYNSNIEPAPAFPIVGLDISNIYTSATATFSGPGPIAATLIDYDNLVGTFENGEEIQQISGTADTYHYLTTAPLTLFVSNMTGSISAGDVIYGETSGAYFVIETMGTPTNGGNVEYSALTGNFTSGETITGTNGTGLCKYDNGTDTMLLYITFGTFGIGDTLTGDSSGATATVTSTDFTTLTEISLMNQTGSSTNGEQFRYTNIKGTIIFDNGTDSMYIDSGVGHVPFGAGYALYGVTSLATADIISVTDSVYYNALKNGDTITVGGKTYTLQDTLTNVNGNVKIGSDDTETLLNIADAINLTGTPGTQYASAMTINANVQSFSPDVSLFRVRAIVGGSAGNSITCTAVISSGDYQWDGPTLTGGSNASGNDILEKIYGAMNGNAMVADGKALAAAAHPASSMITINIQRPGTYGNGVALLSSDSTAISFSASTMTGGLNNGTTGVVGEQRMGAVLESINVSSRTFDALFECIAPNVWMMVNGFRASSTNAYDWELP